MRDLEGYDPGDLPGIEIGKPCQVFIRSGILPVAPPVLDVERDQLAQQGAPLLAGLAVENVFQAGGPGLPGGVLFQAFVKRLHAAVHAPGHRHWQRFISG